MELKVWINGSVREVCGVTDATTCEDVIFALAQAASLPGFYTLVAQWRGNEITLAPDENPLGVIKQLGENPNNFELILRRLGSPWSPSHVHVNQRSQLMYKQQAPNIPVHKNLNSEQIQRNPPTVPQHLDKKRNEYANQNPTSLQSSSKPRIIDDNKIKKDLQDQLTQQEQKVEQNRLHLLQLENEINIENQNIVSQNSNQLYANTGADLIESIGPAAELQQLASTNWSELLDQHKKKQVQLTQEKYHLEFSIKDLDRQLNEIKSQVRNQEERITNSLDGLLDDLDIFNQRRAEILGISKQHRSSGSRVTAEVIRSPGIPLKSAVECGNNLNANSPMVQDITSRNKTAFTNLGTPNNRSHSNPSGVMI